VARRVVGIDLGERRIGVAVSDPTGTIATPLTVIERSGDADADRAAVAAVVREVGAERVVVGVPVRLAGGEGPAARAAQEEAAALAAVVGVPVETVDERLSTVVAERSLRERGVRGRARRRVVDKVAAAVILQAWLDRAR
jgi:putative Holliday junction resolvase